jgi:hypothetical protein
MASAGCRSVPNGQGGVAVPRCAEVRASRVIRHTAAPVWQVALATPGPRG